MIMGMDQLLAAHFGNLPLIDKTASAPLVTDEENEKQAQIEIFSKLASDQGIDLDSLSEQQIAYLWDQTFNKTASEEKDDEKEKESEGEFGDRKEEAKKEHEEKKEAAAKLAEAEYIGKVMAHSMVSELKKIAAAHEGGEIDAGETQEPEESKEAAMPPALARALGHGRDAGKAVAGAAGKAGKAVSDAGKRGKELLTGSKFKEHLGNAKSKNPAVQHLHMDEAMNEARKVTKARIGAAAGATAAVGGAAGAAAAKGKKKESSALDTEALLEAVKIAGAAGFDTDEADNRLASVVTLGLVGESTKVASIQDTDDAIQVRALEYLEAAGYPVNWSEG